MFIAASSHGRAVACMAGICRFRSLDPSVTIFKLVKQINLTNQDS
jgi:hypothetical protein